MHPFTKAICGNIWKLTLVKNHTNATNATMHLLRQAIWGDIWKLIQGEKITNVINAAMYRLVTAIWRDIWKFTLEHTWHIPEYRQFISFSIKMMHALYRKKCDWFLSYNKSVSQTLVIHFYKIGQNLRLFRTHLHTILANTAKYSIVHIFFGSCFLWLKHSICSLVCRASCNVYSLFILYAFCFKDISVATDTKTFS